MKAKFGKAEKLFRVIVGFTVIILGIVFQSWWGALGVIPLFIASLGWCPLFAPFKPGTEKSQNQ